LLEWIVNLKRKGNTVSKQLIAIWAEAHNHVIGKNHTMPWHLPAELAHFKKTTMGSAILMGRVTFDGMNRRCLPGRETLILTRNSEEKIDGVATFYDVQSVLDWYQAQDKNLYIIGGKQGSVFFETRTMVEFGCRFDDRSQLLFKASLFGTDFPQAKRFLELFPVGRV